MDTLKYIVDKYNLDTNQRNPIEIPNVGRDILGEWFSELGFTVGVEVGVETGVFAETLCKAHPDMTLFGVDAWQVYRGYRDHTDAIELEGCYEQAVKRLGKYRVTLIRKTSIDACGNFPDNFLDFVYIDANHEWPYITQDIYYWSQKVRTGGIVAGHDYYQSIKHDKCQVKGAVGGYTYAFNIRPWFLLGTRARVPGQIRDTSRSWLWVKE